LRPFVGRSRVVFYEVDDELNADPAIIKRFLERQPVRLLVIINYFGFLQRWRADIAALCAEHGTVLLEDCAHSLLTRGSGETGDLTVVSYRKLLPVFDGGGLRIRSGMPGLGVRYHPCVYSNLLSLLATVKAVSGFRSQAISRAGVADRRQNRGGRQPAASASRTLPMSWFASNGVGNAPLAEIARRRGEDYEFWRSLVTTSSELRPVMTGTAEDVCPLGFPVMAKDRDDVKSCLQGVGVPVTVHWVLDPGVGAECSNSHRLSRRMMTLPLYPDLTAGGKERAADVLRRRRFQ
jgi:dTDP-4-amino-4,6-dideoxygalactose transaminase